MNPADFPKHKSEKTNELPAGQAAAQAFQRLYSIVALLRSPQGCPWDREQSPMTLRESLLEESYECIEAIDNADLANTREELGDLYLLITMISYMHEEKGAFPVAAALDDISEKLIRRHPHVFGDSGAATIPQILKNWDYIKEHVEGKKPSTSIFQHVPKSLPPLQRAEKLQKKAAKTGFDWPDAVPVFKKLEEEILELKEAWSSGDKPAIEDEIGDLLFSVVNLARHMGFSPAIALDHANRKFVSRFNRMEKILAERGVPLGEASLEKMDSVWDEVKKSES
ncbi:MAG: nucleoside triphosphate pyrophosphohydrolase [Methanobacteriota archaeon]|nr:MAG: nucleoside triphosphate pyrophosphohydrolase [Euryarchaeota archaeon]